MVLSNALIREANKFLDKVNTTKVENFSAPSFATGEVGTLHGERSDADRYKFLRITLFGSPSIKIVKGCSLEFKSDSGKIACNSDTKDIESIYSHKLGKGITVFEIYLDDDLHQSLKKSMTAVTITFPKRLFGKEVYSFDIDFKTFSKLIRQ